ncbi:MAG: LLM class flavin-dependent oxidoreductase [Chloroflexi bacterium]|nr:LLM class flavin-dependent oxidoreductase [Chloroflexota bacterium]MDA1269652.1 LLM class flavin-dependent oxidoreductase [Chloroflexota bacterium]
MKFGLFQSVQMPNPKEQVRYYKEAMAQVRHAEKLGFDSVWITEHHFSRHGIVSATLSLLAYLAGVTETIRLGTGVTVLPFHNPIQLAEQSATVDLLSDGRLDFGAGRGFQWGEFHKLNIPMEEASRRFEETMEVLTKAWTATEPFDHDGEFWQFNDMTVHPRPVQAPHPPIYVAASSEASVNRVARNDWNLLIGQGEPFGQVAQQIEFYKGALAEAGHDYHKGRVVVARAMYTAPNLSQSRSDTEAPFMWFKQTGQDVGAPPDNEVELLPEEYRAYRSRFSRDVTFDYNAMYENVALFGTPDDLTARIKSLEQSGVDKIIFFINFGGIEHRKVLDSLDLFAKEVMPNFPD